MPALKLFTPNCCTCSAIVLERQQSITTRPFAGDDLQVLCVILASYR